MDDLLNFIDPFDYSDIIPLDYKSKSDLNSEFEEIYKNTENTKIDWRKRELALKKIARICIGNQGKSDTFLQFFNGQIYPNLDIQLADLRSSLMKEACRVVSFCAKELGTLIEPSMVHMMTQHVLFKIAGNSNKVISENSSRCVLNIVKYVHSAKIITNICEQKILKANNVRVLLSQCLFYIFCLYKKNLINKTIGIILDTIKVLLSDPNSEVRAMTRKVFIAYKKRFSSEANIFFEELDKSVQKQINEDEKVYMNIINIQVDDSKCNNNKNLNLTAKKPSNNNSYIFNSNKKSNSGYVNNNNSIKNNYTNNNSNSNINVTPVKNKKHKNLYTSNIKQKSHEIKFPNRNIGYLAGGENSSNINKKNTNKNNIKNKSTNRTFNQSPKENKELNNDNQYNNKIIENNSNDEDKEFIFTNLNLLRKAKLENSLKNKNHTKKTQKNISNSNRLKSPNKTSELPFQKKLNEKEIKLRNTLKEKNLNDLQINNEYNNEKIFENKNQSEEKVLILIKKLDETKNINDKLLVFQYLFNDFKEILKNINYYSEVSIRKFIDKHVEYLQCEEKNIVSQVIKNLMRMIYYLKNVFNKYDFENIIKIILKELRRINSNNEIKEEDASLSKLIFQLYEIIIRICEHDELIRILFSIMKDSIETEENKSNDNIDYNTCYEWILNLIKNNPQIFENINNFKKYFKIICSTCMNSNKSLELIEILYKTFNENFNMTFREENEDNRKKLLSFLEKNNSLYYQEISNITKVKLTRKSSVSKLNNTTNSVEEDYEELPIEIMNYIESGDVDSFKSYLEKNKHLIPSFLLILSDNEYTEIKYKENLINFTYALISSNDIFLSELDKCIELFINQVIHILLTNKNAQKIIQTVKDILMMIPLILNSEKFFKTISSYLDIKTDEILLKILLHSIKNFVTDNKTQNLEKILPYFAENLLGLINHNNKEIKEEAVYCCVEIIIVIGYKFDKYLELIPRSQQNLINLFIKKRMG